MKRTVDIPWNRYALIAELIKRMDGVSPQFGKTALQKHLFLLQEIYKINCGYDFELYSYGPFDSQLLSDLDLLEHWGCVSVESVNALYGGYRSRPANKIDSLRAKAKNFLNNRNTQAALKNMETFYGKMTARDLELRATIVYIERNMQAKKESLNKARMCDLVIQIKPKFTPKEIAQAIDELSVNKHIQLAA